MAKKRHSHASKYLNPPFDPRILQIGPPSGRVSSKRLQRGRLVQVSTNQVTAQKHGVQFLYNPVAVTATHNTSVDASSMTIFQMPDAAPGTQTGQFVDIGDVSVDLLYDRTYELWDKSKAKTLAGRFGVYADVLAFYFLLGITGATSGTIQNNGVASTGGHSMDANIPQDVTVAWQSLYPTSFISPNNLYYLYIGDKMRFYGKITSFSVTYSHWTHAMIPMRCEVSLNLQFQTDPKATSARIKRKAGIQSGAGGTNPHTIPGQ